MTKTLTDLQSAVAGSHLLRNGVLEALADADLDYSPGGDNLTLGALFVQLGEQQHSYTQSLMTRVQDWSYEVDNSGLGHSRAQLEMWFKQLDQQMAMAIDQLSADDLDAEVDRGSGITRPISSQLEIYTQTVLIFLSKATVYLRTMQKPVPPAVAQYIG